MKAPRFTAGERLGASKLNRVSETANLVLRSSAGPRPLDAYQAARVFLLEVKTLNHSPRTLTCTLPGTSGVEEFTVELPQIFTEASRGTVSYTYDVSEINRRDATDSPDVETQEITPPFVTGESILVGDLDEGDRLLFLGDGRMWAKIP